MFLSLYAIKLPREKKVIKGSRLLPFLTSNRRNFLILSEPSSSEKEWSTLFAACNFFFHSDGDNGVALMAGSSKGRCDIPPSNCKMLSNNISQAIGYNSIKEISHC